MAFRALGLSFLFLVSKIQGADSLPPIISINDVTEEMIDAFWSADPLRIIVAFPENSEIPLRLFFSGNFFELIMPEEESLKIRVAKDFYLLLNCGQLHISSDLVHWRDPYEVIQFHFAPSIVKKMGTTELLIDGDVSLRMGK